MSNRRIPRPEEFEKLGVFFMGREVDPQSSELRDDLVLYDAKDLTTHAVCVGMTGSGKTGLCLGLLEEAAMDSIPAIAIDPKGDLPNLLLSFPELRPEDFRPWIDSGEASRKGMTPDQYADRTAQIWKDGLAGWGQGPDRIRALREKVDFAIYTPASDAGLPLTVLRSFAAPPPSLLADADALRGRVAASVSGLLALLGIDADPVRSREHILLSSILTHSWRAQKSLDIAALIHAIQAPPFSRIGVMDLESVYPAKDRFELAMALNNLLASPGFSAWLDGEPLDISRLLWTESGKPRVSILSIAHLSDPERMFFVTLVLNELLAWMRTQPGTSSLRALLYMDEIFGYFPPTANPPSKTPMLTLLKQARAYGLGVVLATQNPVDLDYKGLSNTGTWFLGRLQTERDKMRVLDGLEGASSAAGGSFDRGRTETILSGLKSRTFLMNNVHEDAPVLFQTRWVMSYLRGPLTRTQIRGLMAERKTEPPGPAAPTTPRVAPPPSTSVPEPAGEPEERPMVPADVPEFFAAVDRHSNREARLVYRPALLGTAELHHANARMDLDEWRKVACLVDLRNDGSGNVWEGAQEVPAGDLDLNNRPEPEAAFSELPPAAAKAKSYTTWERRLKSHLYQHFPLTIWKCRALKVHSEPGESERDFKIRVRDVAREKRDLAIEKLRKRYAPKFGRLKERIERAQDKVRKEEAQYKQAKRSTLVSIGSTILGALFGRKAASVGTVGRAASTARRAGSAAQQKEDISIAKRQMAELEGKLEDLETEFQEDKTRMWEELDPLRAELEDVLVRPRKTDTTIGRVALVWMPFFVGRDGIAEPAYE